MQPYRLGFVVVAVALATPAVAAQRTFVASYGSDAAPCSISSPCRSFTAALALTAGGGDVVVLDSAGYGPVTIAQSVRIVAPAGVYAAISIPASGNGIVVSGGTYDVTLAGLTLVGAAGSNYGIRTLHGGSLTLERVKVEGATYSISIESPSAVKIDLRDVIVKRGNTGIYCTNATGNMTNVTGDDFSANVIVASNGSVVTVANAAISNANGNGYSAIATSASGGGVARMSVVDSRISNVFGGITAAEFGGFAYVQATGNTIIGASASALGAQSPGATLIASRNSVTRSNIGLVGNVGGTVVTFLDNSVTLNGLDSTGSISSASYQ